ncbi:MAG: glycosyltransferase [Streptosporangiales bacterium]|nr:glycosyltransferase [Streptosporangiales bacterium]
MRPLLRRHRALLVLLALGVTLRVLVQVAYQPALLYIDSFSYLAKLEELKPGDPLHPIGYTVMLLSWLLPVGGLSLVVVVQHLLGLGMAVLLYALVLRRGGPTWLGALAAAPILLDGYQLHIEHNLMTEPLFEALLLGALALLVWRPRPGYRALAAAGLLFGLAATVRPVAEVGAMVVLCAALLAWRSRRRKPAAGWLAVGLLVACFLVPLFGYATWNSLSGNAFELDGPRRPQLLYARAAPVADCAELSADRVAPHILALCPTEPPERRPGPDWYAHDLSSPIHRVQFPAGVSQQEAMRDFALHVAMNDPLRLTRAVVRDFLKGFAPVRTQSPTDPPLERWRFQHGYPYYPPYDPVETIRGYGGEGPYVQPALASFLRDYQAVGYVPGTLLGLLALAGLLGPAGVGHARWSGVRRSCLLPLLTGLCLLGASATFEFSWRYQLPGLILFPLAGALGLTALLRGSKVVVANRELESDRIDADAIRDFTRRHENVRFAPVTIVIAAYNEADAIGPVLDRIPAQVEGLDVNTLVVVDGASDATVEVAIDRGVYVCDAPVNRGQGAALRLGYRLAREGGAHYIVTTDADGQYDTDELPILLRPLLADEADFVTGSRRLGRAETTDRVRHAGVRVFAWLISVLTRTPITDTSNGFRGMKPEVTGSVLLRQQQYQASELLIGVLAQGFRVVEVPTTMHERIAGKSKKGGNLLYGLQFGRVVFSTWLRERSRRREFARAPEPAVERMEVLTR